MPIYEYECERCSRTFEVIQKFSDEPIAVCAVCSGPVRRVLSPPGLVFKGTGWYVTDYARSDQKRATEEGGKETDGSSDTNATEQKSKADKQASSE